jgi:hypothetical protein
VEKPAQREHCACHGRDRIDDLIGGVLKSVGPVTFVTGP